MSISKLMFKSHSLHADIINKFYYLNKAWLTEQMKDALIDAYECLRYVEEIEKEQMLKKILGTERPWFGSLPIEKK